MISVTLIRSHDKADQSSDAFQVATTTTPSSWPLGGVPCGRSGGSNTNHPVCRLMSVKTIINFIPPIYGDLGGWFIVLTTFFVPSPKTEKMFHRHGKICLNLNNHSFLMDIPADCHGSFLGTWGLCRVGGPTLERFFCFQIVLVSWTM